MCPVWWDNGVASPNYALFNRKALAWTYPSIVGALLAGAVAGSTTHLDATPPQVWTQATEKL
jgi:hypothetical protein